MFSIDFHCNMVPRFMFMLDSLTVSLHSIIDVQFACQRDCQWPLEIPNHVSPKILQLFYNPSHLYSTPIHVKNIQSTN